MASDTTKLILANQYFLSPDGFAKERIGLDFLRIYGQTPQEYLLQNQGISQANVGFVDTAPFNVGTQIFDLGRNAGVDPFGDGTGGGTPVNGGRNVPTTTTQGGFGGTITLPTPTTVVGGATTTSPNTPITIGRGDIVGGRRAGPGDPFTPPDVPVTIGPVGTPTTDPCLNPTYRIGKIKELNTPNFPENSSPEFARINKQCILIAEIFKCCGSSEFRLGWVELARSKSSKFYEPCPDGTGKRAVAEQYYDMSQLTPSYYLIEDKLDRTYNSSTVTISSPENGKWNTVNRWSDDCISNLNTPLPNRPLRIFTDFNEYFEFKYPSSVLIEGTQVGIAENKLLYNESSSPSGPAIRKAIPAKCSQRGDCVQTPVTPTDEGPFLGNERVFISRIPIGPPKRIPRTTERGNLQKHPIKPCVLAIASPYDLVQEYEEQWGFPVYLTKERTGAPIRYENIETRFPITQIIGSDVEYINEERDPNCDYTTHEKEYEEDVFGDPCLGVIKKDITRVYADGRREIYAEGLFVRYFRKQDSDCSPETVKVYHPLDLSRDVITAKVRARTRGLFDGNQTLECHHTSSTQPTASKPHYYEVTDCDSCGKTPYFALAYGHNKGSGSVWSEGELNDTPTRAIYGQYRSLALDLPETAFTFYTNGIATASNQIYVVNFSRVGMSDRIDPGNWELALAELRGGLYANSVFTGSNVAVSSSNKVLTFIDDSSDRSDSISCTHDPYVSYDIISGSLVNGAYTTSSRHTYGTMYPNLGILVLDPYKLNTELGFNTVTGSNIAGDNAFKLFTSISGSGVLGNFMKARNVKYKSTNHYFVRVGAPLANYSNNPTYVSGSEGSLFHPCYDRNPQTYITSVGLYDDFNQLLAVAKLSRPINKSFDNDVLIKIRLNW